MSEQTRDLLTIKDVEQGVRYGRGVCGPLVGRAAIVTHLTGQIDQLLAAQPELAALADCYTLTICWEIKEKL